MESVVRKCLNKREKCFETSSCPRWLLTILPNRIKTVESNVLSDINLNPINENIDVDLYPFQLTKDIKLFNEIHFNEIPSLQSTFEYPNLKSFNNQLINNYSQFIYSPSNKQFFHLLNKLKQINKTKKISIKPKRKRLCKEENCSNVLIPLTDYCQIHLLDNNSKQILFSQCNHCRNLSIKEDKRSLLHFCTHLNI